VKERWHAPMFACSATPERLIGELSAPTFPVALPLIGREWGFRVLLSSDHWAQHVRCATAGDLSSEQLFEPQSRPISDRDGGCAAHNGTDDSAEWPGRESHADADEVYGADAR